MKWAIWPKSEYEYLSTACTSNNISFLRIYKAVQYPLSRTNNLEFVANFTNQAPVVRKVDSAIHWIVQMFVVMLILWIAIYPVDSAIQLSNNRGQPFLYICF